MGNDSPNTNVQTPGDDSEKLKDTAGVTGGKFADPDANPAFHGEEVPGNKDPNEDGPTTEAFDPDGAPVR